MKRTIFNTSSDRMSARISGFLSDGTGGYQRVIQEVEERAYDLDHLRTTLRAGGFTTVYTCHWRTFSEVTPVSDEDEATFVVAGKW